MVLMSEFRKWQRQHPNFMTPSVLHVKQVGNYFVELSKGRGFENDDIFGVTAIGYKGNGEFTSQTGEDFNKAFQDLDEAQKHFNYVIGELRKKGVKA